MSFAIYSLFSQVTIDIGNVVREQNDLINNMVSKEFLLFFQVMIYSHVLGFRLRRTLVSVKY